MAEPSFVTTPEIEDALLSIVPRVEAIARRAGFPFDAMGLRMDLLAVHNGGCPLDFERLAAADDGNLGHDVFGIVRHIDRETGALGGCFVPRHARPEGQ